MSTRKLTVGAAQMGPIARAETRGQAVRRQIELLRQAKSRGCDLVVFPELAFTSFFPRWYIEDEAKLDRFFEREMPGPETAALFDEAARLGIGFSIGYAELVAEARGERRFNTAILVDKRGCPRARSWRWRPVSRTSSSRPPATSTSAAAIARPSSTSRATASPRTTA
jgi:predicted amidohydrolase